MTCNYAADKVAIVGGAGFVGSKLQDKLVGAGINFKVLDVAPDLDDNSHEYLDVTEPTDWKAVEGCDVLINLAAEHRDDVKPLSRYYDVNVKGAQLACDAARAYGIKHIIFTSSVAVYGFAPPDTGEEGAVNYFNEYGRTKYLAEEVYRDWQKEDPANHTLVIVRPTVVFGPSNRGNVYNLLDQIARQRFVMFGSGKNVKSMAYVDNVAGFLVHCIGARKGIDVINYVDKPDMDMNELVEISRRYLFGRPGVGIRLPAMLGLAGGVLADLFTIATRKPLPISLIRVKKFLATTQFSSKASGTGYVAAYSLREGLEATLESEFKGRVSKS